MSGGFCPYLVLGRPCLTSTFDNCPADVRAARGLNRGHSALTTIPYRPPLYAPPQGGGESALTPLLGTEGLGVVGGRIRHFLCRKPTDREGVRIEQAPLATTKPLLSTCQEVFGHPKMN